MVQSIEHPQCVLRCDDCHVRAHSHRSTADTQHQQASKAHHLLQAGDACLKYHVLQKCLHLCRRDHGPEAGPAWQLQPSGSTCDTCLLGGLSMLPAEAPSCCQATQGGRGRPCMHCIAAAPVCTRSHTDSCASCIHFPRHSYTFRHPPGVAVAPHTPRSQFSWPAAARAGASTHTWPAF